MVADRLGVYWMNDNHTFVRLAGPLSGVLAEAERHAEGEQRYGMLCPVIVLAGEKELRRVGSAVHGPRDSHDWPLCLAEWKRTVSADADIARLLPPEPERQHSTYCNRGRCYGHSPGETCFCGDRPCDCSPASPLGSYAPEPERTGCGSCGHLPHQGVCGSALNPERVPFSPSCSCAWNSYPAPPLGDNNTTREPETDLIYLLDRLQISMLYTGKKDLATRKACRAEIIAAFDTSSQQLSAANERLRLCAPAARFVALSILDGFPETLYEGGLWDQAQEAGLIVQRTEKHAPGDCESCDDGDIPCWVIAPGVEKECNAALAQPGEKRGEP